MDPQWSVLIQKLGNFKWPKCRKRWGTSAATKRRHQQTSDLVRNLIWWKSCLSSQGMQRNLFLNKSLPTWVWILAWIRLHSIYTFYTLSLWYKYIYGVIFLKKYTIYLNTILVGVTESWQLYAWRFGNKMTQF